VLVATHRVMRLARIAAVRLSGISGISVESARKRHRITIAVVRRFRELHRRFHELAAG
jgi:hypothetical protein